MNHYALIYHLAEDYMDRRPQFREEHLGMAKDLNAKGQLLLGGAFANPPDTALLVFKVDDKSVIEDFVSKDPYVKNGLVNRWEIREWTVVIGK